MRIEQLLSHHVELLPFELPTTVKKAAQRIAAQLIEQRAVVSQTLIKDEGPSSPAESSAVPSKSVAAASVDLQTVEVDSLELTRPGTIGLEMRSLDLDLFNPIGIDETKARFIEALLLTCLLKGSPPISDKDHQVNNTNQLAVANFGRNPGLELVKGDQKILLQDWANRNS
ncbi:MAG: hypothetical protein WCH01_18985 [Methylococcaceae bacterium]